MYGDSDLPPTYTVFGTIIDGLDVIDDVAAAGSNDSNGNGDGKPLRSLDIVTVATS